MTSVTAWNDMMMQFLNELRETFPEEPAIKKYYASFDLLRKSNPRKCVTTFMEKIGPHQASIMAKDEKFITDDASGFLADINLNVLWNNDVSDNTKQAIWQYLQTLYILGTTITMIPQEALSMIENVATKCVGDMQNGDQSSLNNLLSSLGGMIESQEKK